MRTSIVAVILVVMVGAVVAGAALSYHGVQVNNNSSHSTTLATSSSSRAVAVISSSTTSSQVKTYSGSTSTSAAVLSSIPEPISTATALFGNFTQLSIQFAFDNGTQVTNSTYSFSVAGHPTVNGTTLTEVNYDVSSSNGNGTALTVYYDSNYTAVMVTIGGQNLTGFSAEIGGSFLLVYTELFPNLQSEIGLNSSAMLSYFKMDGTSTQTFGNLKMDVTTYTLSNFNYSGNVINNAAISIGQIPGSTFSMVTSLRSSFTTNGTSYTISFELVSATIA
jgi:hypothetical protein